MIICGGVLVVDVCEPGPPIPAAGPPTVALVVVVVVLGIGLTAVVKETVETLIGLVVLAAPLIGTETGIF